MANADIKKMGKAFFLDRDGVVNVEVDYLSDPEQVEILPSVSKALRLIRQNGFMVIVVTNQSGVARGMFMESEVQAVHQRIQKLLNAEEAMIDDFFYCPHHEKFTGSCDCRKPAPGLLLKAAQKYKIDCSQSVMIGDRLSDIEAGRAAGCGWVCLVKTGYGNQTILDPRAKCIPVAENLLDAVQQYFGSIEL